MGNASIFASYVIDFCVENSNLKSKKNKNHYPLWLALQLYELLLLRELLQRHERFVPLRQCVPPLRHELPRQLWLLQLHELLLLLLPHHLFRAKSMFPSAVEVTSFHTTRTWFRWKSLEFFCCFYSYFFKLKTAHLHEHFQCFKNGKMSVYAKSCINLQNISIIGMVCFRISRRSFDKL